MLTVVSGIHPAKPLPPRAVSRTVPDVPPVVLVTLNSLTSVPWKPAPPKVRPYPASVTVPSVTVPLAGQPGIATPPLAVSRLASVHGVAALAQSPNTIWIGATSLAALAPPNVAVKPELPAFVTVTVPGKPKIALISSLMFWLVTGVASPNWVAKPSGPDIRSPIFTRKMFPALAELKFENAIVCTSLPPCSAFWIPTGVSFWPRTVGAES